VFQIVGLVKDTKYHSIKRPAGPIAYLALAQATDTENDMKVLVRSRLSTDAEEQAIRHTLHDVSSAISFDFAGLQDQLEQSLLAERLLATLSGFFGVLAVVLAMTGLYGVMSYAVTERTTDIGIRIALGAQRSSIAVMILGKAASLLAAGLVLGAGLSLAVANAAGSLLFGLKPYDAATLAGAALLLAAVTAAAGLIPSMRAANVNPIDSLRTE
jgi:putative ABC transport system permease protein